MPEPITPFEYLSRFIVDRNHFRANRTIKHQAFMPNNNGKTSVCRISGITDVKVWEIGLEVARMRGKTLLGRADIRVFNVLSKSLPASCIEQTRWEHFQSLVMRVLLGSNGSWRTSPRVKSSIVGGAWCLTFNRFRDKPFSASPPNQFRGFVCSIKVIFPTVF